VEVNSKGGRSANSFWGSKKGSEKAGRGEDQLADALLRLRPGDIALVMLGTNDVSGVSTTPTMESGFLNNMKNIVKKLHDAGVTVIGIGPPAFPPEDQPHQFKKGKPPKVYATGDVVATSKTFVPKLKKVYTDLNEQFIDSRDITSDLATMAQRRDGIHFTDHDAADAWAARLAEAVSSCL
jgi:lysophospholipase L1-like esterase